MVLAGRREGALAAEAEVGAGRGNQRFGCRPDEPFGHGRRRGGDPVRQSLALVGREDGVAFEEGDRTRLTTVLAGAAAFAVRRKAMGIDDGRAALALAHIAAQCERLPEGKRSEEHTSELQSLMRISYAVVCL